MAWRRHERRLADNLYVYAVVSRRSHGVSIGVNLNPGKACNFGCAYCQVDRAVAPRVRHVDLETLASELDTVLRAAADGSLYEAPQLGALEPANRTVRDIAFSGDGEPTAFARFGDAVAIVAEARRRFGLDRAKIVLITNAAYLSKPSVRDALALLDANNGEIWAKLDAGTEEYFRQIDRPNRSLTQVLASILDAARLRPVVIQSMWMRVGGMPPPAAEVEAFCARLADLLTAGAQLKAVQIYTIARKPADDALTPLTDAEVEALAATVRARVDVPVEAYGG